MKTTLDDFFKAQDIWERLNSFDRIKILEQIKSFYSYYHNYNNYNQYYNQLREFTIFDNLSNTKVIIWRRTQDIERTELIIDILVFKLLKHNGGRQQ